MAPINGFNPRHCALRARQARSRLWNETGAELIEFAFVLPLLLMIIIGIFDFGFLFQRYEVVTNAAREGARAATLPDYQGQTTRVQTRVQEYLNAAGLDGTAATISVNFNFSVVVDANNNTTLRAAQVIVTYPHTYFFLGPIVRLVGGNLTSVQLRAVSTMRIES